MAISLWHEGIPSLLLHNTQLSVKSDPYLPFRGGGLLNFAHACVCLVAQTVIMQEKSKKMKNKQKKGP